MNYPRSIIRTFLSTPNIAFSLIVSILLSIGGSSLFFATASAATLSQISATASSSVPSASTNYTVNWTATNGITTGQTIKISFDPGNSTFDLGSLINTDVITSGTPTNLTIITAGCGAVTANQVSISGGISNAAGNKSITLTACGAIATGGKTVVFANDHVTNPATPGTYIVRVAGTQPDSGDTRVVIMNQVVVSAGVDTSLFFSVAGLATGQTVNGATTSTTTTASTIAFGTLTPSTPIIAGQELTVTTNATNGFVVTLKEDQNLMSSAGSQIYSFKDGNGVATPVVWTAPSATIGNALTYGHFGVTSDDADLNGGEFTGTKYAGNFATTSRTIFSNSGAADGTTQNIGKVRVAFKLEISALQAAASDYSNHLIYVCTPTF